jgi:hypothetical protein
VEGVEAGVFFFLFCFSCTMEQQAFEEYFDRDVGKVLERLGEMQPGQSISFVGLRQLAEVLVEDALSKGMKIQAEFQEGFNSHILTLLEKDEEAEKKAKTEKPVSKWKSWVRFGVLSVLYGAWESRK